ncbi:hypothetical protein C5Y97_03475 [Blastopirellula marina]|uniref:Uncharacterized protein n=2 Tax=Blastopirellula marina TaxID=124 RepID=A0A2S8G997_9BACT|nr:hypothetical protein C5Y98_03475 [Blastopirellula marina]PTL45912.1 hypothetical protein C5Y97_03475 [Blastopirellula marina]
MEPIPPIGTTLEHQRMVDQIHDLLDAPTSMSAEKKQKLAELFYQASAYVNEQLRRCRHLISKGQRADALAIAEREPKLLELVTLLDFPNWPDWVAKCKAESLAIPPRIRIELAGDLNEAYAQEEPAALLLKRHRMLALARAPLAGRLIVLRRLRKLEPDVRAWSDDQVAWEQVRLKQITSEIASAERHRDVVKLQAIVQELSGSEWLQKPDPDLLATAKRAAQQEQQRYSRLQLEELIPQMNAAYQQHDIVMGRLYYEQWQEEIERAALGPNDPLLSLAAVPLNWLTEDAAQTRAEHELAEVGQKFWEAIEQKAEWEEIQTRYVDVQRIGLPIPPEIQEAYAEVASQRERSKWLSLGLIGSGVFCVVVLVAVGSVYAFQSMRHRSQVAASVSELNALVEGEQFTEATTLYDSIQEESPAIFHSDEFQQAAGRYVNVIQEETRRQNRFAELSSQLKQEDAAKIADSELAELTELARTDAEVKTLETLRSLRSSAMEDVRKANALAFEAEIQQIEYQAESELPKSPPDAAALGKLQRQLSQLLASSNQSSPDGRYRGKLLLQRLNERLEWVGQLDRLNALKSQLTHAVGNASKYVGVIEKAKTDFTEIPLAKDLQKVTTEATLWRGMQAWQTWFNSPELDQLSTLRQAEAATLLAQGNQLLAEYGKLPPAATYRSVQPFLEHVSARVDFDGNAVLEELTGHLARPLQKDLYAVHTKSGERYYLTKPFALTQSSTSYPVEYLANFRGDVKRVNLKKDEITYAGRAPHCELADQLLNALQTQDLSTDEQWGRVFDASLQQILQANDKIDPIKRVEFFLNTYRCGATGSIVIEEAYAAHDKKLNEVPYDPFMNWCDPNDPKVEQRRAALKQLFASLPSRDATELSLTKSQQRHWQTPKMVRWQAWLDRADDNTWQAVGLPESFRDGELFVIVPGGAAEQNAELKRIAVVQDGKLTWTASSTGIMEIGRPIYVRDTEKEKG